MKKEYLCQSCLNLKRADIEVVDEQSKRSHGVIQCSCFKDFYFFAEQLDENGFPRVTKCNEYRHNTRCEEKNRVFIEEVVDESAETV